MSRAASAVELDRLIAADLDDGEFVAAEARHGVVRAHARSQSAGHRLQQRVADRVTERVVDGLEVIEIEAEHRKRVAALDPRSAPSSISSRKRTRFGRSVSASWCAM